MSFVTQEDVFEAIEPVLGGVFQEFASFNRETPRKVSAFPFPRIPFAEALLSFGTDKPDLRNPLRIFEVGEVFAGSDFKVFAGIVAKGGVVRAIRAPKAASQPRSFFDKLNSWAQGEGKPGLGYITLENGAGKGPIAKFVADERLAKLKELTGAEDGDSVFFVADTADTAWKFAGQARTKIGQELGVIDEDQFALCWVVDFPMFEYDDKLKKIDFSHNPFSMPQGGLEALETQDPLTIKAGSTTSSATASSCARAPSGTTSRRSCTRRSASPATARKRSRPASAACSTPSSSARPRTAVPHRASIASSCCWPTSPTSARSSPSR